ncbi:TetR/AcrR family transcriptional regulator [Candidatus Frankia alpina]|uniref:TetR/AcrR family transcriptional regulator n=1 Tax=Candidatus Frankia alpina TaxID=2699483 RepID=UPI001F3AFD7E|nr:TetR/AcrR family transcriptional regulator [Candidatus Frankia alpina]
MAVPDDQDDERELIMDAAYRCLLASEGVSVAITDILHAAGLSTRAFYRHFASKDSLLLALFRRDCERVTAELTSSIQRRNASPPPRADPELRGDPPSPRFRRGTRAVPDHTGRGPLGDPASGRRGWLLPLGGPAGRRRADPGGSRPSPGPPAPVPASRQPHRDGGPGHRLRLPRPRRVRRHRRLILTGPGHGPGIRGASVGMTVVTTGR